MNARPISRATLISIALHAAVAALVLGLGISSTDVPNRPAIVYATFVSIDANEDERANSEGPAPMKPTTEPSPLEPEEPTLADAGDSPAAAEPEPPPQEPRPPPERPSRKSEPLAEPPSPPLPAPAEPPSRPVVVDTVTEESPAQLEATEVAVASAEPAPPRAAAVPMPDAQRSMLNERFASWTQRFDPSDPEAEVEWQEDGQTYTAVLRPLPADHTMGMDQLVVEISTEKNGSKMSTEMRLRRLAFSNFAQFVDRWDPEVRIHDDVIDGRFHSNSEIALLYDRDAKPVFHGRVTTASRGVRTDATGRVDRKQTFLGGLETRVRSILLPKTFEPFAGGSAVDASQVQRFAADARITFYDDGTYGWQYLEGEEPERRATIAEHAHYVLAAEKTALHVKGIVKGKVLVYSPERIVIEDDLLYAHAPDSDVDAENYLGLVSDKSVEVAGPDVTGRGDLTIHAAIYAKRRFLVRNYGSSDDAMLSIYGGLIAGSLSATEPRFATKIMFDPRLERVRPPSFPLTDRYELEPSNAEWRIEATQ